MVRTAKSAPYLGNVGFIYCSSSKRFSYRMGYSIGGRTVRNLSTISYNFLHATEVSRARTEIRLGARWLDGR